MISLVHGMHEESIRQPAPPTLARDRVLARACAHVHCILSYKLDFDTHYIILPIKS